MKTIGFVTSNKAMERRRAVLPHNLLAAEHPEQFFLECGYGEVLRIEDEAYRTAGANIVPRRKAMHCDIVCDVKIGDADYLHELPPGRVLFGWAHAVQKTEFTLQAMRGRHTVIAWEEMDDMGRNIFYRNREIAGEAAILQAFLHFGKMPYDCRVAILGRGNTAKGAMRILVGLGAKVDMYGRQQERLFLKNMRGYDVLVNCVMWDVGRSDKLIAKEDLARLKKGTMIIDVSCDGALAIETSRPVPITDPVYEVDGILHYAVDNTPALFPYTASKEISGQVCALADFLVAGQTSKLIEKATVICDGTIVSEAVMAFRRERGLPCE